ncbi:MAG: DivIVA domain-containing protein [Gemmatimonadetes bacterium]|nr:DivIVA domain-containing protein [Gemmatimonadota bacterium]
MIDLTPLDVRKKRGDFRKILRGYDPEEVDTFMDLVAERFEELVRENLALTDKNGRLEEQLEGLVERETAVQEALVSAQKLREDLKNQSNRDASVLVDQARREAELIKAEADTEIGRRLGEAEGLIKERQRALEELERSRLKFLKSFRGLLEREMDAVDVEEARRPLEDIPLELELRGWTPSEGAEPEAEPAEELDVGAGAAAEEAVEEEVAEVAAEEVVEEEAAEEEVAEAAAEEAVEEEDAEQEGAIPDGFDTQVLEGAIPVGIEDLAPSRLSDDFDPSPEEEAVEEEVAVTEADEEASSAFAEDESSIPEEPKWLFSLLKKEQEEKGAEG